MQGIVQPVGGAVLGIGVLLLITSIATLCVVCQNRDTYDFNYGGDGEERSRRNDEKDFERGIAPRSPRKNKKEVGYESRYGESMTGVDSANPRYKYY